MPTTQTFSQPVSTVEPASPLPAEPTPVDVPPVAEPVASDDPFSEPARVVETPSATDSTADVTGPAALGEEAARAYLPLLYGTLDAVAGAMAVWVLRRKLGASTSQALIDQARQIATLTDAERMALEAALVQRLSTVRLSPDEALLLTMGVIYGSKMMAVNSLSGPSALDSSPSTVVSAA